MFGVGSAPQQSLAAFAVLFALLAADAVRGRWQASFGWPALAGGVLLALASIRSAPPMPPAPVKPYAQPADVCRPPFKPIDPKGETE